MDHPTFRTIDDAPNAQDLERFTTVTISENAKSVVGKDNLKGEFGVKSMCKPFNRANCYIHLAKFQPDEILNLRATIKSKGKREFTVNGKTYRVNMASRRYHVFAKSKKCVCCGIEGTVMCLDFTINSNVKTPHFNLYAEKNGELFLMTKDHIISLHKGGPDNIINMQTMCDECNELKADANITVERLRQIIQENPNANFKELRRIITQEEAACT